MILDDIVAARKKRLKDEMSRISIEGWKQRMKGRSVQNTRRFFDAIKRKNELSIIAEVKKASPSKGILSENFNPSDIARQYCESNVRAISVLTEQDYFLGSNDYLLKIRQAFPVPVLRKDFIIDLWQIYESAYLGVDAVLLIAAILDDVNLRKFQAVAGILGIQCLVEVHDRNDLEKALESGASIIGINNRDLKSFDVDIKTTEHLLNFVPHDRAVVSESGIKTAQDYQYLRGLGVDAVLIGEAFMKAGNIVKKIEEIRGTPV
jgi:indole-3-glycerol phosphate synthase